MTFYVVLTVNNKTKTISVVIPALNEEKTITEVIEGCKPYADELIVVDGHSRDRTREVSEEHGAKVILDNKKGKVEAIRHVIGFVTGGIIVFIDADGSHDPHDIPKLVEPIVKEEADHVSGSRLIGIPPTLTKHFGIFSVIGLNRVP